MDKTPATSSGIGFCGLLTVVFIALKLTGYVSWGWLWVLAPLWVPAVLGLCILILLVVIVGVASSNGNNPFN